MDEIIIYEKGDNVWCQWHEKYYKAKILGLVMINKYGERYYSIHYSKYAKKWDGTVSRHQLLPFTAENNKFVKQLNKEINKTLKIKKEKEKLKKIILDQIKGKPLLLQPPFLVLQRVQLPSTVMNQCDQSLNSNNFQKDQIESFYEEIDKSLQNRSQKIFIEDSISYTMNSINKITESDIQYPPQKVFFEYSISSKLSSVNATTESEPLVCETATHVEKKYIDKEEMIQTQSDIKDLQIVNCSEFKIQKYDTKAIISVTSKLTTKNKKYCNGVDKKKLYKKHKERKSKNIDIYLDPYDEVIGCYQLANLKNNNLNEKSFMHDDFQIEKNGDQKVDNLKNIDEIVEGQHYINPVNGHNDQVEFVKEFIISKPEEKLILDDQYDLINSKNCSVTNDSNNEVNLTLNANESNPSEITNLPVKMPVFNHEKNKDKIFILDEFDCNNEEVIINNNNSCLLNPDDKHNFINSKDSLDSDKSIINNFEEDNSILTSKKQLRLGDYNSLDCTFDDQSSFELDKMLNTVENNTSENKNLIIKTAVSPSRLNLDEKINLLVEKCHTSDRETKLNSESLILNLENPTLDDETHSLDDKDHIILDSETNKLDLESHILESENPLLDGENNSLNTGSYILDIESPSLDDESSILDDGSNILNAECHLLDSERHIILETESFILNVESPLIDGENRTFDTESNILDIESPSLDGESSILDEESSLLDGENNILDVDSPSLDGECSILDSANDALDDVVISDFDEDIPMSKLEEQFDDNQDLHYSKEGSVDKLVDNRNFDEEEVTTSNVGEQLKLNDQHKFINLIEISVNDESYSEVNNFLNIRGSMLEMNQSEEVTTSEPQDHIQYDDQHDLINSVRCSNGCLIEKILKLCNNKHNSCVSEVSIVTNMSDLEKNIGFYEKNPINETNSSGTNSNLVVTSLLNSEKLPDDKDINNLNIKQRHSSNVTIKLKTNPFINHVDSLIDKKLDCEVSPISKFKKSNLSRNCPIITTTPLTNTKNIKNEKIIVDDEIIKKREVSDFSVEHLIGVPSIVFDDNKVSKKKPSPAFNDYTINLNGNHLSGIACSSISTTVTSNKRKIIYHKNGILDKNNHVKKSKASSSTSSTSKLKKKKNCDNGKINDVNNIENTRVHKKHKKKSRDVDKKYCDKNIGGYQFDDPLEKSKVSSSTSIAISNKRKIIDHKDILAKQFKKNSSSKLKLEPQNENNLMVHTADNYSKKSKNSFLASKVKLSNENKMIFHKEDVRIKKSKCSSSISKTELLNDKNTVDPKDFISNYSSLNKSNNSENLKIDSNNPIIIDRGSDIADGDDHSKSSKIDKKHKQKKSNDINIYFNKDNMVINDYQTISKPSSHSTYNDNWSWESASSSTSIPLSNHPIDSDDDNDGQTTDDDDQYVKNKKVYKKNVKPYDLDNSIFQLFGFDKTYSRAAKVKANEAISQMSKPPIIKEKKNDKRPKFSKKKDEDDPWYVPSKLTDYNLEIPLCVSRILIEDKHLIEDDRFISILPAKCTVYNILCDYAIKFPVCEETLKIIINAFNQSLYNWLLHPIERPKYKEMLNKYPGKSMCQIYGLPHLLRFIMKLPKLFHAFRNTSNEFIPHVVHFTRGLFIYFVDEDIQISLADYDCVMPDYYRMAYFS